MTQGEETRVRILVADQWDIVRRGVCQFLEAQTGWSVCGQAATGREAIEKAVDLRPDVVALGINMPDLDGLKVARQIRREVATDILLMVMPDSANLERAAAEADVSGLFFKSDAGGLLIASVQSILLRRQFPSPTALSHGEAARRRQGKGDRLTIREQEVLRLLAIGHTNRQVAAHLGIATKTAETHRARIIAKLDVHSVSGLVRYAIRQGLIAP